jgi:uncharacterized membrane protein (UPF0182 family)
MVFCFYDALDLQARFFPIDELNVCIFLLVTTNIKLYFMNPGWLMLVGLLSVFTALLLVYMTGSILIRIVNRFAHKTGKQYIAKGDGHSIASAKMAAIATAVSIVTAGKGRVAQVSKK